jgi:hypothetical protein
MAMPEVGLPVVRSVVARVLSLVMARLASRMLACRGAGRAPGGPQVWALTVFRRRHQVCVGHVAGPVARGWRAAPGLPVPGGGVRPVRDRVSRGGNAFFVCPPQGQTGTK